MKKCIILFLAFFLCNPIFSQVKFGLKAGFNYGTVLANVNKNGLNSEGKNYLPSLHAGLFARKQLNDKLSIETNLLYSREGYKQKNFVGIERNVVIINSINMSMVVGHNFLPKTKVILGPELGYLLSVKEKIKDEG